MPISVKTPLRRLEEDVLKQTCYEVMEAAFEIHAQFGRFFDELVYKRALADRLTDVRTEVEIDVRFRDFRKSHFIDLVAGDGAVFELKAVEQLTARHRSQLLNYLLLTGLEHGKLVNFRTTRVQHEFVNATIPLSERIQFAVSKQSWQETDGFTEREVDLVIAILSDWGTCLDLGLYEEALTHFLGGFATTDVLDGTQSLAKQRIRQCAPGIGIKVTSLNDDLIIFEHHARSFLQHTSLRALQWVNISRHDLTFTTLINK